MSQQFREAHTDLDTTLGTMAAPHNQLEENFQMEEFVSDAQPVDEDYESEEPFVPTEAEKDAEERAARVINDLPFKAPAKRPRSPAEVVDDDLPDLNEIFDNYDTPKATRISVCRAYASYLASTMPKKPAAPRKRNKK